jgi:hypothetical protein
MKKYLSKSLFKNALDCRTKLYYASNNHLYKDNRNEDPFLKAIAEGGFQVGELAKCYYPSGIEIDSSLNEEDNFNEVIKHLKKSNVTLFEGNLIYGKFISRFDILIRTGNVLKLIEVKSKSYINELGLDQFLNKRGASIIKADWIDQMYDVAYQRWILSKLFPRYAIESYLMMADKTKVTTVDNLNQKFILTKDDNGNTKVIINGDISKAALGEQILVPICVDSVVDLIDNYEYTEGRTFDEWLTLLMESFEKNEKLVTHLGKKCGDCQFHCTEDEEKRGWHDGKKECFLSNPMIGQNNYGKPTVLDIWNYRGKDKQITSGNILMEKIDLSEFNKNVQTIEDGVNYIGGIKEKIEQKDRQLIQIVKTLSNDNKIFVLDEKLKDEMLKWKYPYHMIDFETTTVAIPFHAGLHPYEGIAFQFSHHIMYEDGRVEHSGEYINRKIGFNPNFEFVRELKKQLEKDNGSIFRYSPHENTFLNHILIELFNSSETDKDELIDFIKTITYKSSSVEYGKLDIEEWVGERNMVDLWDVLKAYYYNPFTEGSNSIKYVLPSILKTSDFLKNKYTLPIYGTDEIKSLNFKNHAWLTYKDGEINDPYKTLPETFVDIDPSIVETFVSAEKISDGGAAMTAYAKIQFSQMSEIERNSVIKSLLKYCELDTFAMIMLVEHWQELIFGKTYTPTVEIKQEPKTETESVISDVVDNIVDITTGVVEQVGSMFESLVENIVDDNLFGDSLVEEPVIEKRKEKKVRKNKTFSNVHNIKTIHVENEMASAKIIHKKSKKMFARRKSILTERWIRRFKKDSTEDLSRMLVSKHYNENQKVIINEILERRLSSPIRSERVVNRMKKESTEKLKNMLKSEKYTDFQIHVVKDVLKARGVRLKRG